VIGDSQLLAVNAPPAGFPAAPVRRTPGSPPGTTNPALTMMGLGSAYTPQSSGNVLVTVSGQAENDTNGDAVQYGGRWGTGNAPTNGTPATGTRFGPNSDPTIGPFGANVPGAFSFTDILPATAGVQLWVDLAIAAVTGGTASVKGINVSFVETG
jgi:hypothetical protein